LPLDHGEAAVVHGRKLDETADMYFLVERGEKR